CAAQALPLHLRPPLIPPSIQPCTPRTSVACGTATARQSRYDIEEAMADSCLHARPHRGGQLLLSRQRAPDFSAPPRKLVRTALCRLVLKRCPMTCPPPAARCRFPGTHS